MSKIIITGSAIVLKSSLKLEDLKKLGKYRPDALTKKDDKGSLLFKVAVAEQGNGSAFGKAAYFAPVTHDADGLATITLAIPEDVKDVKEYAADLLGETFTNLQGMEESLAAASHEVDAAKAAMLEKITQQ